MAALLRYLFSLIFLLCVQQGFGQYRYYGKPELADNKWAIGAMLGSSMLISDVPADRPGWLAGLYVNKEISRVVDLRLSFQMGQNWGQSIEPSRAIVKNSALNGENYLDASGFPIPGQFYDSTRLVYHNYSMRFVDLSFTVRANLNKFSSRTHSNWDIYLLAGLGTVGFDAQVNALKEAASVDQTYPYENIESGTKPSIRSQLDRMLDPSYETPGQRDNVNGQFLGRYKLVTNFVVGLGARVRLDELLSLGLEGRYNLGRSDLMDAQMWDENNDPTNNFDRLVELGFTLDFTL